jgi:hypothetical protein
MFSSKQRPNPKTSETCEMLLESVKKSIRSSDPFSQQQAKKELEMLKKNRCKKALLWIYDNYRNDPSPFAQQFAKRALECSQTV